MLINNIGYSGDTTWSVGRFLNKSKKYIIYIYIYKLNSERSLLSSQLSSPRYSLKKDYLSLGRLGAWNALLGPR